MIFSITTPVSLEITRGVICVCTYILHTTVLGQLRPTTVNITNESQGMDVSTHLLGTLKHVLLYGSSPLQTTPPWSDISEARQTPDRANI